ncbi:hypothetical protein PCASD_23614 [Puccinia coronata f. sp. avenae]|uniref:Mediator of RNA polymerase II transcription subunit 5 n=1 Tax=Puccinia coronata f. sp. avenae TaxID=200324 RepID=A0A2N5TNA3_9BASI|nr:hypothetical protein PCASD_23614 [Puccinia coronata f. sp. avenae]
MSATAAQQPHHHPGSVFSLYDLSHWCYQMTRAFCKVGHAGIAIAFLDILPEFGKSAINKMHTDFDHHNLLSNTDPRNCCTINATVFKLSFNALTRGLINLQAFCNGLRYFEHKLLICGCAVGIVGWLLNTLTQQGRCTVTFYAAVTISAMSFLGHEEHPAPGSPSAAHCARMYARRHQCLTKPEKLWVNLLGRGT